MTMRLRSIALCFWMACGAMSVTPTLSQAQFAIDKTELFLRPDAPDQRNGVLMVRNEGSERAQAIIKVEDWDRADDGTNRFFPSGTKPGSCAQALKVFPLSISLAPGEAQSIRIDLDAGAASSIAKECWSVVLVESQQPRAQASGRTIMYTLRTGLKVYAAPAGLKVDGEVSDVNVVDRTSDHGPEQDVLVAFKNIGEKHVMAQGRVEVRRGDNTVAASVTLPPMYALAGAEMRVKALMPTLPKGKYVLLAILDYGGLELAAAQFEYEAK